MRQIKEMKENLMGFIDYVIKKLMIHDNSYIIYYQRKYII